MKSIFITLITILCLGLLGCATTQGEAYQEAGVAPPAPAPSNDAATMAGTMLSPLH